ncbi:GIY-YIG nuclease family protein [Patescibacteria group bacterium]|nr:GIY-YIG nuclease family protein [Patescibacteria group bacterium]MBU1472567.1 GIY-YIG nuclease family protein [Patescibacteria group bacterium]MBU2459818.1 GIY-YIG nuclease family protein [Patescibacteria group bacterium]MBU2544120.1 GIY-YIG nuclease family protein [Patescibacteria group bacterium]
MGDPPDRRERLYVFGSTGDLKTRVRDHNHGKGGVYTQKNRQYILIYYEAYTSKGDALKQELFYKTGYGREVLRDKVKESRKVVSGR